MATDPHDNKTHTMPTPAAGPGMRLVELASIVPSLNNPRKWFDQAKLQELADSIAATGVHQPILLRPLPGSRIQETYENRAPGQPLPTLELVCGERRYRASKLAGLAEIPAMIREMDDTQALEAQVIENLQRADVTALEEADAYQALIKQQNLNADEVAEKIGKSRGYVYARLKILDLCDHGQQLLIEGKLNFNQALPIARIPNEELQIKALNQARAYQGEFLSVRQLQQMVSSHYMLHLNKAPFSTTDETLCPAVGACKTCPNRTGANPDLFADIKSADVCTNPPCYKNKETAHAARIRKSAAERGSEILSGKQVKKLVGDYYSDYTSIPGYKRLDLPNDSPVKGKTLRKLIGDKVLEQSGIKPTMIVNPNDGNELIACVTNEQAQQLLQMSGKAEVDAQLKEKLAADEKREAEAAAEQAEKEYETAWRMEVLQRIVRELQRINNTLTSQELSTFAAANRLAAQRLAGQLNTDDAKLLCKLLDLGKVAPKDAIRSAANDWPHPVCLTGCIIALHDRYGYTRYDWSSGEPVPLAAQNPELMAMAAACDVDVEACKAQVQANARAAQAAAAKPETASAPSSAAATAEATKTPPPQRPAARADGVRGDAKSKPTRGKYRDNAMQAPKTSPADAQAAIAAALQAAEAPKTDAPATLAAEVEQPGSEPHAAPGGAREPLSGTAKAVQSGKQPNGTPLAAIPGADAQGDEARSNGTPLTVGGWARVSAKYPVAQHRNLLVQLSAQTQGADAWTVLTAEGEPIHGGIYSKHLTACNAPATSTPATATATDNQVQADGPQISIGALAKVRPNVTQPQQKEWIGMYGKVIAQFSPESWDLSFKAPGKKDARCCFHTSEIEVMA